MTPTEGQNWMNVARGKFGKHLDAAATFFVLLSFAALLPPSACAQSGNGALPQSVVDAARQKATDKKAKRVYTNEDFPKTEPDDPKKNDQDRVDETKSASGEPASDKPGEAAPAANESAEVKQARKIVETKQIQIDTLEEEKTALESRLHEGNRSADESAAISESVRNVEAKIETLKKEQADAQKVIDASTKPKPQDQN